MSAGPILRAIPAGQAPSWFYNVGVLGPWCPAEAPDPLPDGLDRYWGCYRREGHTGRHLGLVGCRGNGDTDTWIIWGGAR